MQETQRKINRRIGWMMRDHYDKVCREPLPERWVDLIKYLKERERDTLPAPAAPANPRRH